jgi:hypothetical protein
MIPLTILTCHHCGVADTPRLAPGVGPHHAKASCGHCGHFIKWLGQERKSERIDMKGARCMDCLNMVAVTGLLERDPATKFEDNGTQFATFTLRVEEVGKDGAVFKTFVPIECYGRTAERAAGCGAGDVVGVEGKLKWKSSVDQRGEKRSTLCVLARQVSVVVPARVAAE